MDIKITGRRSRQFFLLVVFICFAQFAVYSSAVIHRTEGIKPPRLLETSVSIKAALYFGDEDAETMPLQGMTLYLLDQSLVEILKDAGFEPESPDEPNSRSVETDYLRATAAAFSSADEESAIVRLAIEKHLAMRRIVQTTTDKTGRARIKSLPTGDFYLFASSETENQILLWNLPVKIEAGANSIEIDQYNSEFIERRDD